MAPLGTPTTHEVHACLYSQEVEIKVAFSSYDDEYDAVDVFGRFQQMEIGQG